jgi:hypothetical protein
MDFPYLSTASYWAKVANGSRADNKTSQSDVRIEDFSDTATRLRDGHLRSTLGAPTFHLMDSAITVSAI